MKIGGLSHGSRDCVYGRPVRPVSEAVSGLFGIQQRQLSCRLPAVSEKFRQPAQVDGGHGHGEYQLGALDATQFQLAKRAVLLTINEDGFDQLTNDLTHGVAGMASGALIDRAGAVLGVLCDMRRHPDSAAVSDEVGGVVALVGALRLERFSCVAFVRRCPLKWTSGLLCSPLDVGCGPSFGTKLFCEAQARTSVPSTEKCSALNSPFARACATPSSTNTWQASCAISRSRFLEKVE